MVAICADLDASVDSKLAIFASSAFVFIARSAILVLRSFISSLVDVRLVLIASSALSRLPPTSFESILRFEARAIEPVLR